MIRTAISAVALSVALAAAPANAATNLLTNGSFENGLTGWSTGGSASGQGSEPVRIIRYGTTDAFGEVVPISNVASLSPDAVGNLAAYFVSDNADGQSIFQTVSLAAGTYLAGFDFYKTANGNSNPNNATLLATLNGTTFGNVSAAAAPVQTWVNVAGQQVFNVAQSGTYEFSFTSGAFTAKDLVVDRAYLIAAVPEPTTWAMMLVGFGMIGATARYRRRSTKAVLA